ncbi:TPM domain-containing protein [Streptomyces sp. TRM49041]|uniref:TPM domain-containing protein n=1 Tax=Streptomyces sp. TRM49041 TaxID=2603216 RepID=UPI0011EDE88E|nr:TPM domain-containing protein [Streptomyces sp. TRM49041]
MTRRATRALGALLTGLLVAAWWLMGPAAPEGRAEEPVPLAGEGQITDRVDALGVREPDATGALDRLYDEQRVRLFVVYVRDFSGRPAPEWARETADRNGLGADDVLLAVATGNGQYAYTADPAGRLSQTQLDEVARTAIDPALLANDWAGAAIGAAEGYGAVLAGRPVPVPAITQGAPDPGDGGSPGADLIVPVVLVAAVLVAAGYAYITRRRRTRTRTTPHGGVPVPQDAELDARARRALVDTDDAVRTSREELGFAVAQCGEEAAKPFTEAVAYAQGELTAAFRLRQEFDDAHPEDETVRRAVLEEIAARCADADRRLDEESDAFDRLRDLERTAPSALTAADATHRELSARLTTAEAALVAMRGRYTASAAEPVSTAPEQAAERLEFAAANLRSAREALGGSPGAPADVVGCLHAAEAALGQAGRLVDGVDRRAVELAEAAGRLPEALAEAERDLAESRELSEGAPDVGPAAELRGRVARLESVVGDVRLAVDAGRYDPLDALRRVGEADAALDEARERERLRERDARRVRAFLGQALLTARSALGAAEDYLATHRGAVRSEARTRLAEARRHLGDAGTAAEPRDALQDARCADTLARQAQALAEQDVRLYAAPDARPGGPGGLGGAVLGGIVLGGGAPEVLARFGGGGTRGRSGTAPGVSPLRGSHTTGHAQGEAP